MSLKLPVGSYSVRDAIVKASMYHGGWECTSHGPVPVAHRSYCKHMMELVQGGQDNLLQELHNSNPKSVGIHIFFEPVFIVDVVPRLFEVPRMRSKVKAASFTISFTGDIATQLADLVRDFNEDFSIGILTENFTRKSVRELVVKFLAQFAPEAIRLKCASNRHEWRAEVILNNIRNAISMGSLSGLHKKLLYMNAHSMLVSGTCCFCSLGSEMTAFVSREILLDSDLVPEDPYVRPSGE